MKRALFRVDPRLIHATMMNAWVPALHPERIIVADANVAQDPRRRAIMEMSGMDAVPIDFVSEEAASAALADRNEQLMVLFSDLQGAERALQAGLRLRWLNVGHLPEGPGRRQIHPAVHLGPEDDEIIARLRSAGVYVFAQPLPRDARIELGKGPIPASGSVAPLSRPAPAPEPSGAQRVEAKLPIVNERGLHLRAAHALAHLAGSLKDEVRVGYGGDLVNAKSLLGLTTLGAAYGAVVDVVVSGPDAERSMSAIRQLFDCGFHEGPTGGEGAGP